MAKTFLDFIANCEGGMQSGVSPLLVEKNQIAFGLNISLRGGYIKNRPPIQKKILDFGGDVDFQAIVETGFFQGAGYYRPDFGIEPLLAQIDGHLIQFKERGSGGVWDVVDVSVPSDLNDPTAAQVWMNQAEKWMIVTDGSTKLPIFFDGAISRRSYGESVLLGTTAQDFVVPLIGGTVDLTLTDIYTGPFDVPILLNGEFYQPVSSGSSGKYQVTLTNVSDPGSSVPLNSIVSVIPAYVGFLDLHLDFLPGGGGFPAGSDLLLPVSTVLPPLQSGITIQMASSTGTNYLFNLGVVAPEPGLPHTYYHMFNVVTMFGPILFNTGTLIQVSGSTQPTVNLGTTVAAFSVPAIGSTVVAEMSSPYTGPSNQPVWINGQQYLISPGPVTPSGAIITVINNSDTSGQGQYPATVKAGAELFSVPELPAGRMGAYGMARQWLSLTDGISYIAGDIVGGPSGTQANDFRDSVLKTTENDFLAGGGTFRLPGTGDIITAMFFPPILDTSLGQGQLVISTPFSMFSNNSPVDRATWTLLTSPLQTESLKDNGALAQNSTILVNSDAFFRSYVGIGSLVLARRAFLGWGNKPISNEMQRILNRDNPDLLPYGSAITYDNRFLSTCAPNVLGSGVFHVGLISLNFDLISTLRTSQPPAWESVWTGINSLQVVSGRVNGSKRAFAFTFNINTSKLELYEFLQETTESFQDNDSIPIVWVFETPVLFNKDIKPLSTLIQLADGEFYISDVKGEVLVEVFYRPDFYPCWQLWQTQTVCVDPEGQYPQAGYRMRLGLGEPSSDPVESGNNRPLNIGNFFQFRVQITGSCKWHGLKVAATEFSQPVFAQVDTPPECQSIDCEVPDDLTVYSLQGLPPKPVTPVPHIFKFFNVTVYFNNLCGQGVPSMSADLPNWITLDAANNRFVGKSGVIGGDSQDQANANAQLALNQFAEAQLEAGNIVCDIFLAMIWGGNGLFGGVNQLGTNNYPQLSNTANLTATFTPNSGASDSFICLEVHHTAPTSQTFTGESIGHLVYNGPGFNGNLHIVVTCTGSFATNWAGRIKVYTPGATSIAPDAAVYYLLNATFAGNQLPNGTVMDIPFTVPSTGGVPIVIAVDIQGGNNTSGATANQSWQLSGTVSVVP